MNDGWNSNLIGWENNSNRYNVDIKKYDLIIVLAGGLDENGKVHEWVRRRLERSIELHKIHKIPILCCGGGTYHKPPFLNDKGFVVHESTECVNYLIQRGVEPNMIYREWSSYDTIANAFFALTSHITCREEWKNIIIVTSDFHLPRSKAIFDWVFSFVNDYLLTYKGVSDVGIDKTIINARKERERESLNNIIKLKSKIKTLNEFHNWLYKEHNAYNSNPIKRPDISKNIKKTY